jgi:site-specific DNA recombinase
MLVCRRCGYALYRTSTQTSKHKLYYYRCLGSDAYRHLKGAVCDNPPIRQDHLDAVVWTELLRLLEDPELIQAELDRRTEAARNADPLRQRQENLRREQNRLAKNMDRLLTAYQEGLMSLDRTPLRDSDLSTDLDDLLHQVHDLRVIDSFGDLVQKHRVPDRVEVA